MKSNIIAANEFTVNWLGLTEKRSNPNPKLSDSLVDHVELYLLD